MDADDISARHRPDTLTSLAREDLDPLSVAELNERIVLLEAEISRTRAKIATVVNQRASADAIFKSSGG